MAESVQPTVLSVTEANELVNDVLVDGVGEILVEGEISDLRIRRDTWVSFALKDESSSVECFSHIRTIRVQLEDGMSVRVLAKPKLYVPYGKYSLNLIAVELVGEGALQRAYQLLLKKLESEGLFSAERKRPLPRFPQTIGLITSGEGAALHDVRRVLSERWGSLTLKLYPVAVQGRDAVSEVLQAIAYFTVSNPVDVLILTRGGGSLEDLQAFNDELVVRAVAGSRAPTIVAIGHESDTSLAELVADRRAATPSNAAQIVVPDRDTVALQLEATERRIEQRIVDQIAQAERTIQRLIVRSESTKATILHSLTRSADALQHWSAQFNGQLADKTLYLSSLPIQLAKVLHVKLQSSNQAFKQLSARTKQLGPQQVLARGYSFTRLLDSGTIIRSTKQLSVGQTIETQLADGRITSELI